AAAGREERRPAVDCGADAVGFCDEILGDERLLAVLAAADVEEIVLTRLDRLADRHRAHLEFVAAPGRAPSEHRDVSAIRVDVEVIRIEMSHHDLHAARSQYGRTKPRSATIFRS